MCYSFRNAPWARELQELLGGETTAKSEKPKTISEKPTTIREFRSNSRNQKNYRRAAKVERAALAMINVIYVIAIYVCMYSGNTSHVSPVLTTTTYDL